MECCEQVRQVEEILDSLLLSGTFVERESRSCQADVNQCFVELVQKLYRIFGIVIDIQRHPALTVMKKRHLKV